MSHIIQQNQELPNKDSWIFELANVITNIEALYQYLELDPATISLPMLQARKQFPLRVPIAFADRMKKGDYYDPLLQQVLCLENEIIKTEGYSIDPLNEHENVIPGLLHKYYNRALLLTKTACAINCRYCFRRHFPYQHNQSNRQNNQEALTYIGKHTELDEIILSGGDPLMAKDHELAALIESLEQIPHIKRLRIHTRLAIAIPSRITSTFCQILAKSRLKTILVTHINHPNEIDEQVSLAINQLKQHNITLLNQSVLLKNINDHADTLAKLSDKLFSIGILPYYLHLLDKVQGTAHFFVDDETAKKIVQALAEKTSGYLVPKLAREVGGEKSKRVLALSSTN